MHRVRRVFPGCPKSRCCVVEGTTEAKATEAEGEPGPMGGGFWQGWEVQELGQALLDALVVGSGRVSFRDWTQPTEIVF